MVTDTIKQEDVHPNYRVIKCWLKIYISNTALYTCKFKWEQSNDNYIDLNVVRNKIDYYRENNINPVTKW